MIQDLRADSANFERSGDTGRKLYSLNSGEQQANDLGYDNSLVHRSRQHWGPTAPAVQVSFNDIPTFNDIATRTADSHPITSPSTGSPERNESSYSENKGESAKYRSRAPPGYYLASDGRFYPESSKPVARLPDDSQDYDDSEDSDDSEDFVDMMDWTPTT